MPNRTNPRILVVDDCQEVADSLAKLLTHWGYDAEACYGGAAALEAARTYEPDVVLLDVGMPDLNGFEVALGLREMPGLAGTTIVGVTGYTDEDLQVSARDAGFDHCLLKPLEISHLRKLIGGITPPGDEVGRPRRGTLTTAGERTRGEVFAG